MWHPSPPFPQITAGRRRMKGRCIYRGSQTNQRTKIGRKVSRFVKRNGVCEKMITLEEENMKLWENYSTDEQNLRLWEYDITDWGEPEFARKL
jgi:hypothetical protein